ncbi:MAG: endonuclease/exonuclease/phosphatase family protein [Planctomycetota bacterium]|nr:MAG: endonuclease/exonuclease/phosphatase family protein [Planctomycetota bacterium]
MRVISWNILGCRGWRRGEKPQANPGPPRPWVPDAMVEALAPLAADIIALQECPERTVVSRMAQQLDMHMTWLSSRIPGDQHWPGGFPGALLSRWPMSACRDEVDLRPNLPAALFQRHWGNALIQGPWGPVRIHAYHCCADFAGGIHDKERSQELTLVSQAVHQEPLPCILVGDHNCTPGSAPLDILTAAGFHEAHSSIGSGPGWSDRAIAAHRRIDHCWLRGCQATAAIVLNDLPFGSEDPQAFVLSDHRPIMIDCASQSPNRR